MKLEAQCGHNDRHSEYNVPKSQCEKCTQGISNPFPPRLMTIKQASQFLGLTVWAIRERIWAGQLPVVRFGNGRNKMFLDKNDLEQFIAKHKSRYV